MTSEIKKIGHNIDLKNIIVHQAIKEQGIRHTTLKKADGLLEIKEKERLFIGRINKVYHRKSSPIYGIFGKTNEVFKNYLKTYLLDNDFYTFTIKSLEHYKLSLEAEIASTGGFMIFAHFINTDYNNEYLLILTINNKNGYVLNENDLTIKDAKSLDLNKVDVACLINLTKWKNIESGLDTESKTYLSFVKGKKDVSYYFLSFIDCDNKQTGSEASQRLVKAMDMYCDKKGYDRTTKIKKRNDVFRYCDDCMNNKTEIQLSVISALLDPEDPQEFQEFASDEEYGVSSIISGDRSKLKPMKFVMYKNKQMTVEFDCALLGKEVVFNSQKKELTIKKLPKELIDQIPQ